jgi:hypothetical protein
MEAERLDRRLSHTAVFLHQQGTREESKAKVNASSPSYIPQQYKTWDSRTFAAFSAVTFGAFSLPRFLSRVSARSFMAELELSR